ncbi:ABC transporter permease [Tuwongella immobilis]|uniref:: ABC2_membrane_3 n=1 Tax=Tuwongella immobilis TaxID=692036 RepID=A0A6C2YRX0_9BACT|nr:ABC transporter permease [Tuwongella immobilis]VIP03873.1 : ABC2_membrane_3 [Tuwongella immobilis]VTS05113.1 : ABC2_membrane_3 [Tuwongella immobilis]
MRWRILKALFAKEVGRYVANRGGIALAALLVVATILLSVFNPNPLGGTASTSSSGGGLVGGLHHCVIDSAIRSPWIDHLRANIPPELAGQILFRREDRGNIGVGVIRIRPRSEPGDRPEVLVQLIAPEGNAALLAPYEAWFWRESRRFFLNLPPANADNPTPATADDLWMVNAAFEQIYQDAVQQDSRNTTRVPVLQFERADSKTSKLLDPRLAILMSMIVFSFYFTSVYLLPAFTCEERERGVLLAQALSPASPLEMLLAKAMFYPVLGFGLAVLLVSIYRVSLLSQPFIWLAFAAISLGFLGVGLTIACLVKTPRGASMGAMLYTITVALLILICQQNNIPLLPYMFLEYHGPKMIHAAINAEVTRMEWFHLWATMILALIWCWIAIRTFQRQGWQ